MKLFNGSKDMPFGEAMIRVIVVSIMIIPVVIAVIVACIPLTRSVGDKMLNALAQVANTFNKTI